MNLLISVITAVYNDEKYIKKSVESILNQTVTDFEYIIVDDGSTDDTLNILEEIAKKDNRLIILTQKNLGAATARNKAINAAKGTYIALQDSDDISSPDRLKMQLNQLLKSPQNLISCTSHKIIDTNDNVIATNNKIYKNINDNILKGNFCVCHPTLMASRNLILKMNGYNPFYKKTEDYDLILRLLENKAYLAKINNCLYSYRIRENSEGSKNNGAYIKRVYENHLNRINNRPENFSEVVNDYKSDKDFIIKRQALEIFYSENYSRYIKFYLKNFYKLPANNYSLFFVYALLPSVIKRTIKSIR